MCNLYELKFDIWGWAQAHEDFLRKHLRTPAGALEGTANIDVTWKPQLYPDYRAPIVRLGDDGAHEAHFARWGMPSSKQALFQAASKRADKLRAKGKEVDFAELLRLEPDSGTTNIRNTDSRHWKPWLVPEHRCLVPLTAFSEPGRNAAGAYEPIWFALAEDRPLAYFAGIWTNWTCVRKAKEGEVTCDLYGFLTTEPNAEVGAVHPKAMPVILTKPEECEAWLTAPWEEVRALQRPLADGAIKILDAPAKAPA
jgi:putative SOS response-associated peptidase YedK